MSRPRNRPETVGEWMTAGLGLGLLRPAPGTWGSLPPVAIACALALLHTDPRVIDMTLAAIGLVFGLSCLAFGERAEARFGKKDPGAVVADELAGQSLALMWLPWSGGNERIIATAAIAFFAFRFFDIVKPPPARGWQRFPAGFGILIDDLVAGLYALVATQVLVRILW
ncbi:MAG: phosphatidylglycerophosphatase A [Phycisphaerales bacterium]